jgi:quercetin dioxygenase-like cupin family protein
MSDAGQSGAVAAAQHRAWDQIEPTPVEAFAGQVNFKALTGEEAQLLLVEMKAGVIFPNPEDPSEQDIHPSEQIVLSGRIKFEVDGRTWELGPGEALSVPPNVPHSCEVLEDVNYYEVFVPPLAEPSITESEVRTA